MRDFRLEEVDEGKGFRLVRYEVVRRSVRGGEVGLTCSVGSMGV